MAPLDDAMARPEFESVHLDIDADETHRHIADAIKGLAASETDEGVNYRTLDGMLVAVVGDRNTDDGERATLAFRTAPASVAATRKATRILEALEGYVVEE